jgi:hypothetical protein
VDDVNADLVVAYASLFVQRWDQYALQQRDGSYWRVGEPLSLQLLEGHLLGRWTLGTYLLDADSCCSFAVFDADREDGLEQLAVLSMQLAQAEIPTVVEASRRGGHVWVHLSAPTPGRVVRQWLVPYALAFDVELYPKQDELLPGGSGSLIRLPLGVHRRSRGWYPFVQWTSHGELMPVGETVEACCAWLCQHVERVAVPATVWEAVLMARPSAECHETGRSGSHAAASPPARSSASIQAWCQTQDIRSVIGRYVALDRRGIGSCPFKEHHSRGDVHPSFQVFEGPDPHWYCYTCQQAGNVFDFLCLYHGLSPHEAWRRLQAGTLQ